MDKQPLGADAPLDDADLLMPSPAVCRAMAQFHLALAQKAMATHDFTQDNLRQAKVWLGASRREGVTSNG